jgi:hypothetical protein
MTTICKPAQLAQLIQPLNLSRGLALNSGQDLAELIQTMMQANAERIDHLTALLKLI